MTRAIEMALKNSEKLYLGNCELGRDYNEQIDPDEPRDYFYGVSKKERAVAAIILGIEVFTVVTLDTILERVLNNNGF